MQSQASLFEAPVRQRLGTPAPTPATIELRPYQLEAVAGINATLEKARSALIVMATGTGKTTVFAEAIRQRAGRCLVLAHRGELIDQAVARIRRQTGKTVAREKAGDYAWAGSDVVVASVQSLHDQRIARFNHDEFELVVADEAHHYVAKSFRRILDHFSGAKILGVTATPDRADEQAMGQVFDEVAYVYDIEDGIRDGFLCPIRATQVLCGDLDLADINTVAGDLNQGQLNDVMSLEKVLHQVAKPTMELAQGRRTLVFTTSVENAHRMAEVFNRYRPDCARAVDGESRDRARILADHQAGRFQFLVNVQVLTEGYDDPAISCVAMARPTKSRSLYAQMAGRGTRIAPGKTDLLLLDFVGNSGRHALVSAADILAGKHADEVVERAKKKVAESPGVNVQDALAEAEEEVARQKADAAKRAAAKAARVQYQKRDVDPFRVLGMADQTDVGLTSYPPSVQQREQLAAYKIDIPPGLTDRQAQRLLNLERSRRMNGWCTYAQAKTLQKYRFETKGIRREDASRLISAIASNAWKPLTTAQTAQALGRPEPGSDG